jgi:hypothetical protein
MGYSILIGIVVLAVVVGLAVSGRARSRTQDDVTSTRTKVPGPDGARAAGPAKAPPGSQPDREAHGKQ